MWAPGAKLIPLEEAALLLLAVAAHFFHVYYPWSDGLARGEQCAPIGRRLRSLRSAVLCAVRGFPVDGGFEENMYQLWKGRQQNTADGIMFAATTTLMIIVAWRLGLPRDAQAMTPMHTWCEGQGMHGRRGIHCGMLQHDRPRRTRAHQEWQVSISTPGMPWSLNAAALHSPCSLVGAEGSNTSIRILPHRRSLPRWMVHCPPATAPLRHSARPCPCIPFCQPVMSQHPSSIDTTKRQNVLWGASVSPGTSDAALQ